MFVTETSLKLNRNGIICSALVTVFQTYRSEIVKLSKRWF